MGAKFDSSLLDVLVCPVNKTRLSLAPKELLAQLNKLVDSRSLKTRQGVLIQNRLESALLREDQQIAYPIIDGVPQLLSDDGIELHYTV